MDRRNSGIFLLIIYFLLAIYLLPLFLNGGSANDLTRWATAVSLVEKNSFEISWTKDLIGGEFIDVTKTSDGKIYSNKSPGIALLSAPFYAFTKIIIGKPTKENVWISWFVLRFLMSTMPLLLLTFWLYGNEVDAFSLGVLLLATPLFPYSLLYYSHVLVAVLIYLAFRLIYDTRRVFAERCFTAGMLCGFSLLCESSAIVPMIIFGIGINFTEPTERVRRVIFYLAGISPFIFAFVLYNQLVFGFPFAFVSHYEFTYPTLSAAYQFLISPSHGLFVLSPVLIFSVFTFFDSEHSGTKRHRVKIVTIIFTIIATIGFAQKYGGEAVGARHLIIVIPLMLDSFFDGEIEDYPSLWRGFFFAISMLFCALPMLTFPLAPPELQFPHNSFWQPLLYENNLWMPTMANIFGLVKSIWTILPAMILLLLAMYFVWRDAKYPLKFAVGLLAGILLVGNYMFLLDFENEKAKPLREKVVREVKIKN